MKPLTRVYPYFDGVDVSAHCRPSTGSYGDPLVTNSSGVIEGEFLIPNSTFRTGTKNFKLIDNAVNDDLASLTYADHSYTAKGILETRQKTIVSSMETRTVVERVNWNDPLAQSFLVDMPGGLFLTKLRLYFNTKDDSLPVSIDVREMENGQPTQTVVPYSQVTVNAEDVAVSEDASLPTDFVFETPVYLQEGAEYCFVIMSDSLKYNVWVSHLGERVVGTNTWVSKQPYVGVMFKSQNSSTWTESQLEDIKFDMFRAKFTSLEGTVNLKNGSDEYLPLPRNPFRVDSGSSTLIVYHPNHGFNVGSKVTFTNATGGAGIDAVLLNTTHTVDFVINFDYYTIELGAGNEATSSSLIGGDAMSCGNIQFSTFRSMVREVALSGTGVNWTLNGTTGKSVHGSETPYQSLSGIQIVNSEDINLKAPMCVYNEQEEIAHMSGNKSLQLVGSMYSTRDNMSPFIDVNRLGALAIRNRINRPEVILEELPSSSDVPLISRAVCRYINKTVSIDTPATQLKVWFDVQKLTGTEVKVYYRTLAADAGSSIAMMPWTEMVSVKSSIASSSDEYQEEEHEIDIQDPFTKFQIKLVPLSTSESRLPLIRNLRALALS